MVFLQEHYQRALGGQTGFFAGFHIFYAGGYWAQMWDSMHYPWSSYAFLCGDFNNAHFQDNLSHQTHMLPLES